MGIFSEFYWIFNLFDRLFDQNSTVSVLFWLVNMKKPNCVWLLGDFWCLRASCEWHFGKIAICERAKIRNLKCSHAICESGFWNFFAFTGLTLMQKKSILSATLRYFIGEKLSKMMVFEIYGMWLRDVNANETWNHRTQIARNFYNRWNIDRPAYWSGQLDRVKV